MDAALQTPDFKDSAPQGALPESESNCMNRYQPPCIGRKNHKWNLEDVCRHCDQPKVLGKERAAEWRSRHKVVESFKPLPKKKRSNPTWKSVETIRALHKMKNS